MNQCLTLASNMLNDLNLTDMETCYKAFRAEVIKAHRRSRRTASASSRSSPRRSRSCSLRIYEVPISYQGRTYAEGKKIGWKDGVRAIYCIFKYGLRRGLMSRRAPAAPRRRAGARWRRSPRRRGSTRGSSRSSPRACAATCSRSAAASGTSAGSSARMAARLVVTDTEPHYLDALRRHLRRRRARSRSPRYDLDAPPPAGRRRRVGSTPSSPINVIEHIADDRRSSRGSRRCCGRAAACSSTCPACPIAFGSLDVALGHHRRYTPATLTDLLRSRRASSPRHPRYVNLLGLGGWLVVRTPAAAQAPAREGRRAVRAPRAPRAPRGQADAALRPRPLRARHEARRVRWRAWRRATTGSSSSRCSPPSRSRRARPRSETTRASSPSRGGTGSRPCSRSPAARRCRRRSATPAGATTCSRRRATWRSRAVAEECVGALAAAGVEAALLKGLAYERTLYPQPGARPTSDVDLLVRARDRRAAFDVLDRLGFEPRAAAPGFDEPDYHEVAWNRGGVEVDLHLALAPYARCAIDYEDVWRAGAPARARRGARGCVRPGARRRLPCPAHGDRSLRRARPLPRRSRAALRRRRRSRRRAGRGARLALRAPARDEPRHRGGVPAHMGVGGGARARIPRRPAPRSWRRASASSRRCPGPRSSCASTSTSTRRGTRSATRASRAAETRASSSSGVCSARSARERLGLPTRFASPQGP